MDATRTLPFDAPDEITEMSFVDQTLELSTDHGTLVWASQPSQACSRPRSSSAHAPEVTRVEKAARCDDDSWAGLEHEHTAPLDDRRKLHTSALPTAIDGSCSSDLQGLVADVAAAELRSRRPKRRSID